MQVKPGCLLLAAVLSGLTVQASAIEDQVYSCSRDDHTRQIVIDYEHLKSPVPCKVDYIKETEGNTHKTLWQAQTTAGFCEKKTEEFVSKLEGWGWKCELKLHNPQSASSSSTH